MTSGASFLMRSVIPTRDDIWRQAAARLPLDSRSSAQSRQARDALGRKYCRYPSIYRRQLTTVKVAKEACLSRSVQAYKRCGFLKLGCSHCSGADLLLEDIVELRTPVEPAFP